MSIELSGKQKKCIELMMEGKLTQKEIAAEIKVTEKTICEWKKNENFMEVYDETVRNALRFSAAKAFSKVNALIDDKNPFVAFYAAKDVLDRGGFKPTDKMELTEKVAPTIIDDIAGED